MLRERARVRELSRWDFGGWTLGRAGGVGREGSQARESRRARGGFRGLDGALAPAG